nr:DUF2332 domain-containing protein [Microbacterium bovistercoris]
MPDRSAVDVAAVRERYARFAREEAPGRSPLYAQWASGVASDPATAAVLARISLQHRQPPLVFAVARMLGSGLSDYPGWAAWLHANAEALIVACEDRGVQTNEPLRCAALLPALNRIDGPIALLEVGASAGLCLYPDRYSYRLHSDHGAVQALDPADGPSPVTLHTRWMGEAPALRLPEIVWRAGIDLRPRDARDPDDRAWITGLVWPGEQEREQRIRAALDVVAADPPLLQNGDVADLLPALAAQAPTGATLVVTTPGVLAHVPRAGREQIAAAARRAGVWITLDAPGLHTGVAGRWHPAPEPRDWPNGAFAVAVDGVVMAAADPLGGTVRPIGAEWEWHPVDPGDAP